MKALIYLKAFLTGEKFQVTGVLEDLPLYNPGQAFGTLCNWVLRPFSRLMEHVD